MALKPVTGTAKTFIKDPDGGHIRDGVHFDAVKNNADTPFPDGPLTPNFGYAMATSAEVIAAAKGAGMSMAGASAGVMYNDSYAKACMSHGIKSAFPIRDFVTGNGQPSSGGHGTEVDFVAAWKAGASSRKAFAAMVRNYMKVILDSTTPGVNENVILWGPKGDDSLECPKNCYNGTVRQSCNTPPHSSTTRCFTGSDMQKAYAWLQRVMLAYDDPHGSFSEDGATVHGHPKGLRRGLGDIPFGPGYTSYGNINRREYTKHGTYWTTQDYWGYDAAGAKGVKTDISLKSLFYRSQMKVLGAAHISPKPTSKPTVIVSTLYSTRREKNGLPVQTRVPASLDNMADTVKTYRAQIIAYILGGSHGFYVYQYRDGANNSLRSKSLWPNTSTALIPFMQAWLWGRHIGGTQDDPVGGGPSSHGGVTRHPLGAYRWGVYVTGHPSMQGTSAHVPPGAYLKNSHTHQPYGPWYNQDDDMIMWGVKQFQGKTYFCVLNGMPEKAEYDYLNGPHYGNGPSAVGQNGRANFRINTRFTFPNFGGQLKCTDMLTGANIPLPASGAFVTDISLNSYEHKIYVFEPADGYEGGSGPVVPEPVPVITSQPGSLTLKPGAALPTLHVGYTPANAAVQWEWKNTGAWGEISGETHASYKMTSKSGVIEQAQNNDQFRAKITTYGNAPVYSHIAHITVEEIVVTPPSTGTGCVQFRAGGVWHKAKEVWIRAAGAWHKAKEVDFHGGGKWNACAPSAGEHVVITHQPANIHVKAGDPLGTTSVDFTPPTATVQWQWRHPTVGSQAWIAASGATHKTYAMYDQGSGIVHQDQIGDEYRAAITLAGHVTYSHSSLVVDTVSHPAPVVGNVDSHSIHVGEQATFSASVSGAVTMHWQYRVNSTTAWHNIANATRSTYKTPAAVVTHNGYQYRLAAINPQGTTYSNVATLHVSAVALKPTVSVLSDLHITVGEYIHFVVSGTNYTNIVWRVDIRDGRGMQIIPGQTGTHLNPPSSVVVGHNEWKYQATLSGPGGSISTRIATVYVTAATIPPPDISLIPNIVAAVGSDFTITAHVTGAYRYQWKYRKPGGIWQDWVGQTGLVAHGHVSSMAMNGYVYQILAIGAGGTNFSNNVLLTTTTSGSGSSGGGSNPVFVPKPSGATFQRSSPHGIKITFNGSVKILDASKITFTEHQDAIMVGNDVHPARDVELPVSAKHAAGSIFTATLDVAARKAQGNLTAHIRTGAITVGGQAYTGTIVLTRV